MNFDVHMLGSLVPESYSRELDERIHRQEMPYGYTNPPPHADTGDFNQYKFESHCEYPRKKGGRAV